VRTERGEEAVNAWLETMKKKTRWRIKAGEDEAWIDDRAEAERTFATRCFDKAFEESRMVDVSGAIPAKNLSPSLLTSLKLSGSHARKHPAILIPAVCRAVEIEHLPVFKRQGKLHTGPARPHPLPFNAVLAERPNIMVEWIRANKPAKLEGLWRAVLPEGSTAPPADFAADLFWLLHQGHILLFTDDTLVVQETRETPVPEAGGEPKKSRKKKKKSKGQPAADGETAAPAESADEAAPAESADEAAAADEATEEAVSEEIPAAETAVEAAAETVAETPAEADMETTEAPVTETESPGREGAPEATEPAAEALADNEPVAVEGPAPEPENPEPAVEQEPVVEQASEDEKPPQTD
jgi:hypothetical protein